MTTHLLYFWNYLPAHFSRRGIYSKVNGNHEIVTQRATVLSMSYTDYLLCSELTADLPKIVNLQTVSLDIVAFNNFGGHYVRAGTLDRIQRSE